MDLVCNPSASLADVLLPAASCWEREGLLPSPPAYALAEHTGTWAQFRPALVPPVYEARSELQIIFELATRLGLGEHFFGGDIEAAFRHQLAPSGVTLQQLRDKPIGIRAEGRTSYQKYADTDARTGQPRGFPTPTRKLELYATRLADAGYAPLPVTPGPAEHPDSQPPGAGHPHGQPAGGEYPHGEPAGAGDSHGQPPGDDAYPLLLTFARLVQLRDEQDRNVPRLRRQAPEPFVEMHPDTAAALGIANGDRVRLETAAGSIRLKARLNSTLHPRVVVTQYGWWQACQQLGAPAYDPLDPDGANANLLIANDVLDPISGSVPHRSQPCRVAKAELQP
jgi:anaerobic selenocysteine-containing dehydrogenase